MSYLRIAQPGQATRYVDLGPSAVIRARGRVGGELVTPQKAKPLPVPATSEARRVQMAAYKSQRRDGRCGRVMRTREVCARMAGHGNQCRTREQLAARVAKRGKAFSIHPENRRRGAYDITRRIEE